MMTCTAGICAVLPYLAAGAYIAIMLAVLGVPQLLTYYLDRRNQRRDRKEDRAESERNREETKSASERLRQERQAENERVRQEQQAENERVRQERQAENERLRQEQQAENERVRQERQAENERNRADAERRHQEMMTLLAGVVTSLTAMTANLVENRQPPPPVADQSEAIADLQRAVTELTAAFNEMRQQIQNGNGRAGAKADD